MAVGATLVVALPGAQAFAHGERATAPPPPGGGGGGGGGPMPPTPARLFALGAAPGATPLPVTPSAPPLARWHAA